MVIVTDDTFEQEVLKSDIPVLVDFWASWCGPCKMLSPLIDQLEEEYEGKIKVCKVNVEETPKSVSLYKISGLPAITIFNNGKEFSRQVGLKTKESIENDIKKVL